MTSTDTISQHPVERLHDIDWKGINDACSTASVEYESLSGGAELVGSRWALATAPVRLDFAGGWTDTPPITYEHGGQVVNVAVRINNKRPLGAKAQWHDRPELILCLLDQERHYDRPLLRVVCTSPQDIGDYKDPDAPGALLKACLVYLGILNDPTAGTQSLFCEGILPPKAQGLELHAFSSLPKGTGLGSSSILAGTILAACARLIDRQYNPHSLVHAVLQVEQMLTTGGGWQDQVGGLIGGAKLSMSKASLPLQVTWRPLNLSEAFKTIIAQRMFLIYTDTSRLAKNLLQRVVSQWIDRDEALVAAFAKLDVDRLGYLMTSYFEAKRMLSSTTLDHPPVLRTLLQRLHKYMCGYSLCGAGGGGYLCILVKQGITRFDVEAAVVDILSDRATVCQVCVDDEGLRSIAVDDAI